MIKEFFRVTVDIPKRIDMDSREFDLMFLAATKGSIAGGTQDHCWRYAYAEFGSYYEAVDCEKKLKEGIKQL